MRSSLRRALGWFIGCALLALPVIAQQTGTISGIVSDPSGAVIPNAAVSLKNEQTQDVRKTVTNSEGFFNFTSVPAATYTVTVESKGFQTTQRTGIILALGDHRTIPDLTMPVAATAEEAVTVTAEAETITPVDSGEKSALIGQKELDNVSIVGRNAAEFIKILPGMAMTGGTQNQASYTGEVSGVNQGPAGSFSANGTRTAAMDIVADGAHVIDPGCNCGQAVNMNQEMMEEVKVLTSNFGADNQKGPVVITGVTKAGGRDFHGEAYFYARNHVLNSNDWYNNKAGLARPESSYYYPGFNISGPILFPFTHFNHNRDKLFFFLGYEHYSQNIDNGPLKAFVPTQLMRQGNFTELPALTVAGSPVNAWSNITGMPKVAVNGVIDPSLFDPNGVALVKLLPLPNANPFQTGGFNYVAQNLTYQNGFQLKPRIDWSISDNTKLYVTYSMQRESGNRLTTLWWGNTQDVPYPTPIIENNNSDSVSANLTHVFSPTLTNEFIFTFTNLDLPNSFQDPSKINPANLGMNYKKIFGNQISEIPEYTGWGGGVATMLNPSGFQLTGSLYARKKLPTISDNVSKVWNTHTVKAGFYWELTSNNQPSNNFVNGQTVVASWGGNSTGNAYADTLLGRIAQYSESNKDTILALGYRSIDFYAQDSWKVSRRLTLDYGIRFAHLGPWYDQNGTGLAVWDPSGYNPGAPKTDLTGITWHQRNPSIPISGVPSRALFYSPRFGLAFDIFGTGRTVLRGGWGMYRYHDEQNVQAGALSITQGAYTYCACNGITFSEIGNITPSAVVPGSITTLQKGDWEQPLTKTYSFTITQRAPWKSLVEVGYVGNESTHLNNWNSSLFNINAIQQGAEFAGGQWSAAPNTQNFRAYQSYQTVSVARHALYQNYNGLQVSWNKQTGRFLFMTNYTFSKTLGVRLWSNEANNLDLNQDYGPMNTDRTHIFNIAYVYQMPDFVKHNRVVGGAINGWQISGISQYQSGLDLQASVSQNMNFSGFLPAGTLLPNGQVLTAPQGMNNENTLGTPDLQLEPFLLCNPARSMPGVPGSFGQFMNPNCFAPPTLGHNGSYVWPYVRGPAYIDHDLSLFKNFQMTEAKKLQFRFSAYNFLNHPIPSFLNGDPNLNLTFNSSGQLTNNRFGAVDNKLGHRTIQLAVKFYF